ncbi:hypothetical protein DID88_007293 [Monilinia fructigena]|uniref:Uncharacterized protein n=1 Tax=Monilinia fructigena TaxID=38457 RepID=A0A395J8A5_9HELO|nr:hypothetical protein DID88_007293 [Monilinia fructigena]
MLLSPSPSSFEYSLSVTDFDVGHGILANLASQSEWASCAFILVMMPILCFPAYKGGNLTAELMNWTVTVYFTPMIMVIIWWFVSAHKWFEGPVITVGHHMIGRDPEEFVERLEGNSDDGKKKAEQAGARTPGPSVVTQ